MAFLQVCRCFIDNLTAFEKSVKGSTTTVAPVKVQA